MEEEELIRSRIISDTKKHGKRSKSKKFGLESPNKSPRKTDLKRKKSSAMNTIQNTKRGESSVEEKMTNHDVEQRATLFKLQTIDADDV